MRAWRAKLYDATCGARDVTRGPSLRDVPAHALPLGWAMLKASTLARVIVVSSLALHCDDDGAWVAADDGANVPPTPNVPGIAQGALDAGSDAAATAVSGDGVVPLVDASAPLLRFPRLGGIVIGDPKNYDEPAQQAAIAKLDLAVLGMYFGWKRNGKTPLQATTEIRARNPNIRLANYTVMTETSNVAGGASDLLFKKLSSEKGPNGVGDWWAYDKDGVHSDWAQGQFGAWDTNLTMLTTPDANGDRYPQWLAKADYERLIDGQGFDVWYCDNNFWRPRTSADWDRDGMNDSPDDVKVRNWYRDGQRAYYDRAKQIAPKVPLMVNADSDLSGAVHPTNADDFVQHKGVVHLALIERLMGKSWSTETWGGFAPALAWYRALMKNVLEPGGVMVDTFLPSLTDYRAMRYAFALTLLDDGYFSINGDEGGTYNAVPWFDEFDLAGTASTKWLGAAVDPPPTAPFEKGVWRRRFEHGMAVVNPKGNGVQTVGIEPGYRRIAGKQSPVNDGTPVTTLTLNDRDGILLVKP